jgi:two-component system, OmpR family, phosphate regulon sensor histidine kinase PhoR
MRRDFWRLGGVLLVALLVGFILGQVFFWLFVAVLIYTLWQQRELYRLYRWLQKPKKRHPPNVSGTMEGIVREIDFMRERHQVRKHKLSQYLKHFQKATAALPDAIVVLNEYGEIEWANEASRRLLGLKWPWDARQRITNLIRHPDFVELMKLGSQVSGTIELPSPTNPELYLNIRLIAYEQGQRLVVVRDVTRLQRLERIRRDFIANISHELRTPLTVLRGYLEILEGKEADLRTWRHSHKTMWDQVTRMQHLIEDLLMLSRLENREKKLAESSLAIPEMLQKICQEAQLLSGERQHRIQLEAEASLWLRGDERALHSAFSNLVINAVRYTPSQGTILVCWFKQGARPCLEVRDSGEGIAPEHIPRLTERFYRVDKGRAREKGGTGLGLAIVKHALHHHGAYLEIESEVGKGSTFRCLFPPERGQRAKIQLSKAG